MNLTEMHGETESTQRPGACVPSFREKVRRVKKYRARLDRELPDLMRSFTRLYDAATAPGSLDTKTKELIGLALGVAARCDECIAIHMREALKSGATDAEIIEVLGVNIEMGGGPAVMYAAHALAALEELHEQTQ
jgi:AhpD family alkylhydroperoxidase